MNVENSIIPFLGKTVKFMEFYVEEQFADAGLSLSKIQFVFLKVITENNGQPQNNLAGLTGRDKTTFTRNINTLERKGLVERKLSEQDKRIKLVYITPKGTKALQKADPIIKRIIGEVEEGITDEERESFLKTLTKIRTKVISLRESNW